MPELPEVETVRRTLEPFIVGQTASKISIQREDVVRGKSNPKALLKGAAIEKIVRRGKQLALVGGRQSPPRGTAATSTATGAYNNRLSEDDGREARPTGARPTNAAVCVHLGMTGSLTFHPANDPIEKDKHAHVSWQFPSGVLVFRDPRRFGGIWTFDNLETLALERWGKLGEDALTITPAPLQEKLSKTQRPLKTALLDQNLIAGLGNIYVDEILFAAKLNPSRPSLKTSKDDCKKIVAQMRKILTRSIDSGGSTIRDYVSGTGEAGGFQNFHKVYGRAGEKCLKCKSKLELIRLAGRSTVFCSKCQK